MPIKTYLLSTALLISFVAPANAQSSAQASSDTDEIFITSTRLGQTAAETAAETGTAVSVITREDIEQLGFGTAGASGSIGVRLRY